MEGIMTTMRNLEEDKRMSLSIFKLVSIMNKIRYCKDIECLVRESSNLALLAKLNKDIWNWNNDEFEDFIVFGLRRTILEIPKIIEGNTDFKLDFSSKDTSKLYKKIRDNIKKTFSMLHLDVDVQVDMDTKKDKDTALKVHLQLNNNIESLDKQFKMEKERAEKLNIELKKQMEEEKKIDDMQRSMQKFFIDTKREIESRKKMFQSHIKQSNEMLKTLSKNKEELEYQEDNVDVLTDDEGFGFIEDENEDNYYGGEGSGSHYEAEGSGAYYEDEELEDDISY